MRERRERERDREMEFVEGSVAGERVVKGKVFPLTLVPPGKSNTCHDLVEMVRREKEKLSEALAEHGAILLRGFQVDSIEDFEKVVEAFGWEEFAYEGAADRNKVSSRTHTASEAPLHMFIPFHHEMALIKKFAPKVFFYCLVASPEGGETSIVRSDVIVEEMEKKVPDEVEKLIKEGFKFLLHAKFPFQHGTESDDVPVWQRMLKTEDKVEAKKRAFEKLACNEVKFNEDGTACFTYEVRNPIREFKGRRVWFNTIHAYDTSERGRRTTYMDGSPLSKEVLQAYSATLEDNCVDVKWVKGDVLLLDNLTVQHARRAGKPPRAVLVSLSN